MVVDLNRLGYGVRLPKIWQVERTFIRAGDVQRLLSLTHVCRNSYWALHRIRGFHLPSFLRLQLFLFPLLPSLFHSIFGSVFLSFLCLYALSETIPYISLSSGRRQ